MQTLNLEQLKVATQAEANDDRWFHAKVQASIDGLKDGSNRILSQQEVDERRAALRARLEAQRHTPV